ncbi:MAG: DEAD/DEAH box helicase family protein [Adlercreutzia equolifaciens]
MEPDGGRKNPLLMYKRGAVVHFAVSEDEVWMCTNLGPFPSKSARPRFLPFNLGRDGGAGNPDAPEGEYRTHYLWDTILQRDNWLSIFDRFVFEEVEDRQDASGRWRRQATQIFPRYHQFDAERKVLADAREHGAGRRYLIEHSAGSGKTETISWAAHDLARLRRADGEKMFSSVVVVTDRLSLDQNIKKTISQLSKVTGQVVMIGRDERGNAVSDGSKSSQLVEALRQKREIVVVTIQTFLYAWPDIAVLPELDGAGFAVIVDEAHSSQEGSSAASLKTAFNAAADKLKFERMLDFDDDSGDDGRSWTPTSPRCRRATHAAERLLPRVHRDPQGRDQDPLRHADGRGGRGRQPGHGQLPPLPDAAGDRGGLHHRPALGIRALEDPHENRGRVRGRRRETRRRAPRQEEDRQVALAPPDERHGEGQVDHRPLRRQRGAALNGEAKASRHLRASRGRALQAR